LRQFNASNPCGMVRYGFASQDPTTSLFMSIYLAAEQGNRI